MKNGKSAAKPLLNEEGSTTIPRKGSRVDNYLLEKPNIVIKPLFSTIKEKGTGIYCIYNSVSDKCYVGRAKNVQKRLSEHKRTLKLGNHYNDYLQKSFLKHKKESFYYFIVEFCTTDVYEARELHFIDYFNSYENGYNNTRDTSVTFQSDEIITKNRERQQIKIACLDLNGNFIRFFDSITMAANHFHTSTSNISRCCKKEFRYIKNHIFVYAAEYDSSIDYSIKPIDWSFRESVEYRNKLSKSLTGRKQTVEHRYNLAVSTGTKIKCIDDDKIYHSIETASREYKISPSSIARAIKQKRRCKGLLFEKL